MDHLLSLQDASNRFQITINELNNLIEIGKIRVMTLGSLSLISEEQLKMNLPKREREDYKQFSNLSGQGIHMMAAVRKYGVSLATIQKWVRESYIARIGNEGQKVLLDEADVAYCVHIYRNSGGAQGKWIFSRDGTPYIPKSKR